MTWTIRTDRDFDRAMRKLDRQVAARVLKALVALESLDDPTKRCKALSGPYTGLWRLSDHDRGHARPGTSRTWNSGDWRKRRGHH